MQNETPAYDQTGRPTDKLVLPAQRMLSLCPSISETLSVLGAPLVGRTMFCIHPQQLKNLPHVGGTKTVKIPRVHALRPDLIVAEKEENTAETVAELAQHYPVWVAEVRDINSALQMIADMGRLSGRAPQAAQLLTEIRESRASLRPLPPLRTLYLIWKSPWMAAGRNTYIHAVMEALGLQNAIEDPKSRYPALSPAEIEALKPELVLLSSEPYPFKAAHTEEVRAFAPAAKVLCSDGEAFSWYGARMRELPRLHRELAGALGIN